MKRDYRRMITRARAVFDAGKALTINDPVHGIVTAGRRCLAADDKDPSKWECVYHRTGAIDVAFFGVADLCRSLARVFDRNALLDAVEKAESDSDVRAA